MNYTLRDPNGNVLLAVESSPVVTEADMKADLDKAAKACESAFDEVTKYQDAIAVMSTEGFGEQAKAVAGKILTKIKEVFKKIIEFIKEIFIRGGAKIKAAKLLKKVESMDESEIDVTSTGKGVKRRQLKITGHVSVIALSDFIKGGSVLVSFFRSLHSYLEVYKNAPENAYDAMQQEIASLRKRVPKEFDALFESNGEPSELFHVPEGDNSHYTTGPLKMLGITDKASMVQYLKGVISEDNSLFKILHDTDAEAKAWLKDVESSFGDLGYDAETNKDVIACITDIQRFMSKLSKCTWMFINSSLYIIETAITEPADTSADAKPLLGTDD